MVNDILEQIVEDYFRAKGYFTQHNIKYRPDLNALDSEKKKSSAVHSDIDILAVHPLVEGNERVVVSSCKSWQGGLNIKTSLKDLESNPNILRSGKEVWKYYREITSKVWALALKNKVMELTGQENFIFYVAVTKYSGSKEEWEKFHLFRDCLPGCEIRIIDLRYMVNDLQNQISFTPAHSELSRLLQLIKASGGEIIYKKK
jgi:hypothetical protein